MTSEALHGRILKNQKEDTVQTDENPYKTPESYDALQTPSSSTLYPPRTVGAGRGISWLGEGYTLYRKSPLAWLGLTIIWLVLMGMSWMIPLANNLVQPLLLAGIATACLRLDTAHHFSMEDLFVGFKQQTGSLVLVGAISVSASLVIIIAAFLMGLSSVLSMAEMSKEAIAGGAAEGAILTLLTLLLVAVTIMTPLAMAMWFSPLLIIFHKVPALEAMKLSFNACLYNMIPFLFYALAAIPLLILAAIPAFLGYLILIPVLFASIYTSYKDIFLREGS
ncbi:hypothetical protein A9Q99_07800 [Gammaproteobacteria bacterium 45_16_T64]|nr:hypothetical protein A9Q99_07800 [Gammaproteobacteria bacterium 45_16_T64]